MCVYYKTMIDGIIPAQNFKLVRDRIGLILTNEFANQFTLTSDPDYDLTVEVGRSTPITQSEMPFINVLTSRMGFDNSNQGHDDNTVDYFIDVYAKAKASEKSGDINAEDILLKLLGTARVILVNPIYKTLDFEPGTIMNRTITDINISDPSDGKDATVTITGRITYTVKMAESVTLLDGNLIEQYQTQAFLGETDKGYLWKNFEETDNLNALNGDNLVSFSGDNLVTLN